jgi:hypothetical protein
VYATALVGQSAAGNIYSNPSSIDAGSRKEIYVGVGNYLTILGEDYTAQEIGGQTSAQAGVGGSGINNLPQPPAPPTPAAPTVVSVSPTFGPQTGGTTISVTGTNFVSVTGVTVGNVATTNVSVANSTSLTAITANSPAGTSAVNVTNSIGASNSSVLFNNVPTTPAYTGVAVGSGAGAFNTVPGQPYPSLSNVIAGWSVNYSNGVSTGWTVVGNDFFPPPPGYNVSLRINVGNFPSGTYTFTAPQSLAGNVTPYYSTVGGTPANIQFRSVSASFPSLSNVTAGWSVYTPAVGGGVSSIGNVVSIDIGAEFTMVYTTTSESVRYDSYRFGTT